MTSTNLKSNHLLVKPHGHHRRYVAAPQKNFLLLLEIKGVKALTRAKK